jgi:hypothetical protein
VYNFAAYESVTPKETPTSIACPALGLETQVFDVSLVQVVVAQSTLELNVSIESTK